MQDRFDQTQSDLILDFRHSGNIAQFGVRTDRQPLFGRGFFFVLVQDLTNDPASRGDPDSSDDDRQQNIQNRRITQQFSVTVFQTEIEKQQSEIQDQHQDRSTAEGMDFFREFPVRKSFYRQRTQDQQNDVDTGKKRADGRFEFSLGQFSAAEKGRRFRIHQRKTVQQNRINRQNEHAADDFPQIVVQYPVQNPFDREKSSRL